ncbi:hypothetical protein VKT23_008740 [Stygiomarasmius scandens]|uniref:Uncharacterized protein n=1 Tax=Marasmiellus scandens TaxID=2682957 RepID=A0ABR1JKQ8_9AGAR
MGMSEMRLLRWRDMLRNRAQVCIRCNHSDRSFNFFFCSVDTSASSTGSPRPGLMITNPYPEASNTSSPSACKVDSADQGPEKMGLTLDVAMPG